MYVFRYFAAVFRFASTCFLATAGRDMGSLRFETAPLVEHTGVYLKIFRKLGEIGFTLDTPLVEFTDMTAVWAALAAAGIAGEDIRYSIRAHRGY